jgi:hypothetical protein
MQNDPNRICQALVVQHCCIGIVSQNCAEVVESLVSVIFGQLLWLFVQNVAYFLVFKLAHVFADSLFNEDFSAFIRFVVQESLLKGKSKLVVQCLSLSGLSVVECQSNLGTIEFVCITRAHCVFQH